MADRVVRAASPVSWNAWQRHPPKSSSRRSQLRQGSGIQPVPRNWSSPGTRPRSSPDCMSSQIAYPAAERPWFPAPGRSRPARRAPRPPGTRRGSSPPAGVSTALATVLPLLSDRTRGRCDDRSICATRCRGDDAVLSLKAEPVGSALCPRPWRIASIRPAETPNPAAAGPAHRARFVIVEVRIVRSSCPHRGSRRRVRGGCDRYRVKSGKRSGMGCGGCVRRHHRDLAQEAEHLGR